MMPAQPIRKPQRVRSRSSDARQGLDKRASRTGATSRTSNLYGKSTPPPADTRSGLRKGVDRARPIAGKAVRAGGRSFARGPGQSIIGGAGAILTLIIGTGLVIAVIRNPRLVTVPLQFITGVTGGMAKLTAPPKVTTAPVQTPKGTVV